MSLLVDSKLRVLCSLSILLEYQLTVKQWVVTWDETTHLLISVLVNSGVGLRYVLLCKYCSLCLVIMQFIYLQV